MTDKCYQVIAIIILISGPGVWGCSPQRPDGPDLFDLTMLQRKERCLFTDSTLNLLS